MRELRGQGAFACWQALIDARRDLKEDMPMNFGDCVSWSKQQFRDLFHVSRVKLAEERPGGGPEERAHRGRKRKEVNPRKLKPES